MGTNTRGFASMPPEKARAAQSKGGKAAHARGRAHKFSSEKAREAGLKGAETRRRMILTITCNACEQSIPALEYQFHVC
jgi:general stress protein YciG